MYSLLSYILIHLNEPQYFTLISTQNFTTFVREGFIIDYFQKKLFDGFILNWVSVGTLKLNLVSLNVLQTRRLHNVIVDLFNLINMPLNKGLGSFFSLLASSFFLFIGLIVVV